MKGAGVCCMQVLLPALHRLASEVAGEQLAGAALLRALHARAHSGMPAMHACAGRLLWHCNQVLLSQVTSWCAPCLF
jgi:gamma-tubulin complex component 4